MKSLRQNSIERAQTLENIEIGSFNIKTEISEFNAVETNKLQNSCDIFSLQDVSLSQKFIIPNLKAKLNLNSHRMKPKKTEDTTKDDDSADVPDDESEHNMSSNFANNTGASWR